MEKVGRGRDVSEIGSSCKNGQLVPPPAPFINQLPPGEEDLRRD